jgi:hypothetical protein
MPVVKNFTVSYFDGPPVVSCLAFWIHKRRLTTPADAFDHPYWDWVRSRIAGKATEIRTQGFFGAAMLPYSELEYGGIVAKMYKLEKKFYGEKTGVKNIPLQTLIDCLLLTILPGVGPHITTLFRRQCFSRLNPVRRISHGAFTPCFFTLLDI